MFNLTDSSWFLYLTPFLSWRKDADETGEMTIVGFPAMIHFGDATQMQFTVFTIIHKTENPKYDVKNQQNVSPLKSSEADSFLGIWGCCSRCVGCAGKLSVCRLSCGPHRDTTAHLQSLSERDQMAVVCLRKRSWWCFYVEERDAGPKQRRGSENRTSTLGHWGGVQFISVVDGGHVTSLEAW